jgi:hypothetical protein
MRASLVSRRFQSNQSAGNARDNRVDNFMMVELLPVKAVPVGSDPAPKGVNQAVDITG